MQQSATIVQLPDIQLIVCRANEFPAGIKDSWRHLESKLKSLRDCFLTHYKGHKGHEGLTFEGQNSCKSVKFVAQHGFKLLKIHSLRGRKFYGLNYFEDGQLVYYAALEPLSEHEIQVLGFPHDS